MEGASKYANVNNSIDPNGKLLCLVCTKHFGAFACTATFYTRLTAGPIQLFLFFFVKSSMGHRERESVLSAWKERGRERERGSKEKASSSLVEGGEQTDWPKS